VLKNPAHTTRQNDFSNSLQAASKILFKVTEVFGAAFFKKLLFCLNNP
jgi:hypothetical protein